MSNVLPDGQYEAIQQVLWLCATLRLFVFNPDPPSLDYLFTYGPPSSGVRDMIVAGCRL